MRPRPVSCGMKFSRKTDYGIILIEALRPSFESFRFTPLSEVARDNHLPLTFLQKLAETLRGAGYLKAKRGKAGGYRLARDPKKVTFKELLDIFEEPPMMRCMKSPDPKKHCLLAGVCPSRKKWGEVEEKVNKIFEKVTVDSL